MLQNPALGAIWERQIAARPRSSYPMPDGTRVVHGANLAEDLLLLG